MNVPSDIGVVLDDLPSPVFVFASSELKITWVNMLSQDWLGQSLRNLVNTNFSDHIQNPDLIIEAATRCASSRSPVTLRNFLLSRKEMADERCHLTLFPSANNIALIITQTSAQPNDAHTNENAVTAMGRMLAHEIKNPLAGIHGAAQLLRDDVKTEEGQNLIDLIGSEIGRIRRLADRMETLGDRDPENISLVNIHEILRDARKLMESSYSHVTFYEHYDPSLPDTLGDRDTLMQAILNVIKNAVEAIDKTGENGEVSLKTSFRTGVLRKGIQGDEDRHLPIEIKIIDNGPGIPPNIRDQIFQPFVTDKPTGQGLGLALVAKVVAAHDGLVEVKSRPGKTVFSILLPVLKPSDLTFVGDTS